MVTRYATLNGFHVERRFGWDCHGLPVEYEIDKKLGITCRDDVLKMGIGKYNEECRAIVMRCEAEWRKTTNRIGRWIDFDNDYKTMYPEYMETVWWAIKRLHELGQLYRGYRVMPYSTACSTPLSNFELALNYKDVPDPSVTVVLPLLVDAEHALAGANLLIWTTTPWTLPSNLAVCVHPEGEYQLVKEREGRLFILMAGRVTAYWKDPETMIEIVKNLKGSELVGLRYQPPFDLFLERQASHPLTHTVVADSYVTGEVGTGLVHQAPAFGEDDLRICQREGIVSEVEVPCPIDDRGCFTLGPWTGQFWQTANPLIIRDLEGRGLMFRREQIVHSYPHCWRSDTPLIYRIIPCWFVRVTSIIPKLLEAVAQTHWVPDWVKEKRFHNWMSSAPDWAISRNRFWGTPLPVWASEDWEEVVVVGSVAELEQLTGVTGIKDLHRESIDHLTIPSRRPGQPALKRVEEVLDCWFESGCVPYALQHYPFENPEVFEEAFPADFIGEGIDQTRGWFYTLMVLGVHLFGRAPFKNVIVNGLVLAADGKKMSKRLKNYPEPSTILDAYGADALRLFLINSPVVRGENLRFKEEGVKAIVRDVLLPWYNAHRFLLGQLEMLGDQCPCFETEVKPDNTMDSWIMSTFQTLVDTVRTEMAAYRLYAVLAPLLRFIESLTNWYVRFNRRRLKGEYGQEEQQQSLQVLFSVMLGFSRVMAPFTPFLAENLYQRMKVYLGAESEQSLHFGSFPSVQEHLRDAHMERAFGRLQEVVERVRVLREQANINLKTPLRELLVVSTDKQVLADLDSLRPFILEELNVRELVLTEDEAGFGISLKGTPNFKVLGPRLGKDFAAVQAIIKGGKCDLQAFLRDGQITINGHVLSGDDLAVSRLVESAPERYSVSCAPDLAILLDITIDAELRADGMARELVNRVQRLRKQAGLVPTDPIRVHLQIFEDHGRQIASMLDSHLEYLTKQLKTELVLSDSREEPLIEEESEVGSGLVKVAIVKSE